MVAAKAHDFTPSLVRLETAIPSFVSLRKCTPRSLAIQHLTHTSPSDRSVDIVEKADTEIVGLALEMLLDGTATQVVVVTNDIPLGEAAESLLPKHGVDDEQITWLTGSELADELAEDFVSEFE